MSHIAIRAERLSKQFRIGAAQPQYRTLREHLSSLVRFPRPIDRAATQTIWGVRDVSFEVAHGDVVGIIGRNGAGKSTLLKILSRITEPTSGQAELHGRVGSLLEVGTGFHSELTGRENVYLNGAILGMKKADIVRKFDEIVAFAETGKFIDTPVKHYSTGMQMRLAFAVAAHLEPEILIIDEVLAVGDASFQQRCLGKMSEVAREGRTVLFVSHNMGAVSNLCSSAVWLEGGRLVARGAVAPTVQAYIKSTTNTASEGRQWRHSGSGEARIIDARLLDSSGTPCTSFPMGETLLIEMDIEFLRRFRALNISLGIRRLDMGIEVLHLESEDCGLVIDEIAPGRRRVRVEIPNCMLYPATYQISPCIWAPGGGGYDYVPDALGFSMVQTDVSKRTMPFSLHKQAIFYQPSKWELLDR